MRSKYPSLSQFAIDIPAIPAPSCDCEQSFRELGDLLEPKHHASSSKLFAALQLVRVWTKAGVQAQYKSDTGDNKDKLSDGNIA
jgi:hypothetical protein